MYDFFFCNIKGFMGLSLPCKVTGGGGRARVPQPPYSTPMITIKTACIAKLCSEIEFPYCHSFERKYPANTIVKNYAKSKF